MSKVLKNLIEKRMPVDVTLAAIAENNISVGELVKTGFDPKMQTAWRATWILSKITKKNDVRLVPHLPILIKNLPRSASGHQREIIKILLKMKLSEAQEGEVLDHCIAIWKAIEKQSATRIFAFRFIYTMVKKYHELDHEIAYLSQAHYTENLSPGIRKSFEKLS